jgi:hypothetical protein
MGVYLENRESGIGNGELGIGKKDFHYESCAPTAHGGLF